MSNPVIETAKEKEQEKVYTLDSGVKVILRPIAPALLQTIMAKIVDPPVPIKYSEEKGTKQEDPFDSEYIRTVNENNQRRAQASMDAMAMFGLELVDGLPEDDTWIKYLRQLEKLGHLDLSEYDFDDPIEKEFLYKKFVAMKTSDFTKIGRLTGISQEAISQAEQPFRSSEG